MRQFDLTALSLPATFATTKNSTLTHNHRFGINKKNHLWRSCMVCNVPLHWNNFVKAKNLYKLTFVALAWYKPDRCRQITVSLKSRYRTFNYAKGFFHSGKSRTVIVLHSYIILYILSTFIIESLTASLCQIVWFHANKYHSLSKVMKTSV